MILLCHNTYRPWSVPCCEALLHCVKKRWRNFAGGLVSGVVWYSTCMNAKRNLVDKNMLSKLKCPDFNQLAIIAFSSNSYWYQAGTLNWLCYHCVSLKPNSAKSTWNFQGMTPWLFLLHGFPDLCLELLKNPTQCSTSRSTRSTVGSMPMGFGVNITRQERAKRKEDVAADLMGACAVTTVGRIVVRTFAT